MKPLLILIIGSFVASAQPATIAPPVFGTGNLHDVHSNIGGTYSGSGLHIYDAVICVAGAPDTFKWRKDAGAYSACSSITGAYQAMADGVQLKWAATTGHTVGQTWTVTANSAADQPIGEAVVGDLSDLSTSGTYVGVGQQNAQYRVFLTTVGASDKFKWSKNDGALSAEVTITGAAQAIGDGIRVTFGATTGHVAGDYWTIDVVGRGSLSGMNRMQAGPRAVIRTAEDVTRDHLSAKDWGVLCDGSHDDSTGAIYAARYAFDTGKTLEFPSGKCRFDHQWIWPLIVQRPDQPYGQGPAQVLHIVGQGPQDNISAVGYVGGTVLWYTPRDGSDFITFGTQSSTLNSFPTYSLENAALLGPDTFTDYNPPCNGSACGSGSGIKLVQSTSPGAARS